MRNTVSIFLIALFVVSACDKDKRASKRFMEPGIWQVKELSVAGVQTDTLPTWSVDACDIYKNLCVATWTRNDVNSSVYWQFNDKGQSFKFSRVVAPADAPNYNTEIVEQQTYQFSGVYDVIESTKTRKVFESTATKGYAGQKVRIIIETE